MRPLELIKFAMTLLVCGSIFLAAHLFPLAAIIIGSLMLAAGAGAAVWGSTMLFKARQTMTWKRVFGYSEPSKEEIAAWRRYQRSVSASCRTTSVKVDPNYFPRRRSSLPSRKSPGSLDYGPTVTYWNMGTE